MNPVYIVFILLAVVQGIAEFLPISSSGHLVLFENIPALKTQFEALEGQDMLFINIMLHVATLLAILVYYRKDILQLITGFFSSALKNDLGSKEMMTVRNVIIASIPAGIIGILINDYIETIFVNPVTVSVLLIVNGAILILTKKIKTKDRELNEATILNSLFAGMCQAFAILPGISRSGSTIAGSMTAGLRPSESVRFSFYMAIPVIAGAGLIETVKAVKSGFEQSLVIPLLLAMAVCVLVALFSLRLLVIIAGKVRLDLFGYYTIAAGFAGVLFFSL